MGSVTSGLAGLVLTTSRNGIIRAWIFVRAPFFLCP